MQNIRSLVLVGAVAVLVLGWAAGVAVATEDGPPTNRGWSSSVEPVQVPSISATEPDD